MTAKEKTEKVLWDIAEILRTEIPSSEYRKTAIAIIAASRIADHDEWETIMNAETSQQVSDRINALFARYDLAGMLPPQVSTIRRSVLDGIMKRCESFEGSFGDAYEYCLKAFAEGEGKRGGEYYTPPVIHELIRKMLSPQPGSSVYDPCCGAGLAFFRMGDGIRTFGQEKNEDTWLMAKAAASAQHMKLDVGDIPGDTLRNDLHRDELYDYVVSNPPFNVKVKSPIPDDERWICGKPEGPTENYAWLEHMLSHLNENGYMACVLTISSLTSSAVSDRTIRKKFVDEGYVDAAIILPRNLFYSTPIPVCLWIMSRKKTDRILFINSYDVLDKKRIEEIASCWHEFEGGGFPAADGFCACSDIKSVSEKKYDLSPNSYITFFQKKASSDVEYVRLSDACDIVRGSSESGGTLYPLYGSSDAYGKTDALCPVNETVLIGRKGTIGNPRYVKGEFGVASTSFYIKKVKDQRLSLYYLYLYLQTIDFSMFDSGSGAPSLNSSIFRRIIVPVPDASAQKSLSDAVSAADASYDALSASADRAADLIMMLYERTLSEKSRQQFCRLDQICHIKKGETPSGTGTLRFINTSVLTAPSVRRYAGTCSGSLLAPEGSLFVSYKLSMGRVSVSPFACTWNEGLAMLDAKMPVRIYLFCFLRSFVWNQLPSTSCLGRAVNLKVLGGISVPVPDAEEFKHFIHEATPIWKGMISDAASAVKIQERRQSVIKSVFDAL